ncbi:hypothetical protein AAHA92_18663 [Salvia divinorum]|uniref:Myb/SANT-like domain-containing protein n=1 Tax=Salvia divinorum TaxID=28513 RepID=A0ABD1H2U0_SALDI
MNPQISNQASFFYRGKWNHEMDKILLSTIIKLNHCSGWDGIVVHETVLLEAGKIILGQVGCELTNAELSSRLKVLKSRYNTFKEVVNTHGVRWDVDNNFVVADEEMWKKMFKRNPFVGAYYHRDESDFYLLATVFGLSDIKIEDGHETIMISDTIEVIAISDPTVPIAPGPGLPSASPADPDEVTSPILGGATRVRRKLFDDVVLTIDQQSSNMAPFCCLFPTADGSLKNKMENKSSFRSIPVKKKGVESSPHGSSCASWSPYPTSCKTAP